MITFDGVRLTYIGEYSAFSLILGQPRETMMERALKGSINSSEAEKALAECEQYLQSFIEEIAA